MLVAQYWCDEADDAVHCDLLFSQLPTPDIAAANAASKAELDAEDEEAAAAEIAAHRSINLPAGLDQATLECETHRYISWDANGESIALFAAFCREDCHQEMDPGEAYTPYAFFRRRGEQIDVEVVGTLRRPWLDGVQPSWEAK